MTTRQMLNDEELENVSGGAGRSAIMKSRKAAKYMKIACTKCGEILSVDVNHASSVLCTKCGHKNSIAG